MIYSLYLQVLSCGDNVLFCGLVHEEDISHFPKELTDPKILSNIVNFNPNSTARVSPSIDTGGNTCLSPPVEEFQLTVIDVKPNSSSKIPKLEVASTLFVLRGNGSLENSNGENFELCPGQAYLVPKGLMMELKASSDCLVVYRTSVGNAC